MMYINLIVAEHFSEVSEAIKKTCKEICIRLLHHDFDTFHVILIIEKRCRLSRCGHKIWSSLPGWCKCLVWNFGTNNYV